MFFGMMKEAILRKIWKSKDSVCVQLDDIKNLKKTKLREIFTGKQVVYVYHNQVDARGDEQKTEDEVFAACEEAIDEIGKKSFDNATKVIRK